MMKLSTTKFGTLMALVLVLVAVWASQAVITRADGATATEPLGEGNATYSSINPDGAAPAGGEGAAGGGGGAAGVAGGAVLEAAVFEAAVLEAE